MVWWVLGDVLQHGADLNAVDFSGQSALHWTAVRGSIQAAELLLQSGARLECADFLWFSHSQCLSGGPV